MFDDGEYSGRDDEAEDPDGTPVCIKCFAPVDPRRHYCAQCGGATGQYTQYVEFVNIRWMANAYGALWQKLWHDPSQSQGGKVVYFMFMLLTAPVMLIGLPFLWLGRRNKARPSDGEAGSS
jgi:hypothetical protein